MAAVSGHLGLCVGRVWSAWHLEPGRNAGPAAALGSWRLDGQAIDVAGWGGWAVQLGDGLALRGGADQPQVLATGRELDPAMRTRGRTWCGLLQDGAPVAAMEPAAGALLGALDAALRDAGHHGGWSVRQPASVTVAVDAPSSPAAVAGLRSALRRWFPRVTLLWWPTAVAGLALWRGGERERILWPPEDTGPWQVAIPGASVAAWCSSRGVLTSRVAALDASASVRVSPVEMDHAAWGSESRALVAAAGAARWGELRGSLGGSAGSGVAVEHHDATRWSPRLAHRDGFLELPGYELPNLAGPNLAGDDEAKPSLTVHAITVANASKLSGAAPIEAWAELPWSEQRLFLGRLSVSRDRWRPWRAVRAAVVLQTHADGGELSVRPAGGGEADRVAFRLLGEAVGEPEPEAVSEPWPQWFRPRPLPTLPVWRSGVRLTRPGVWLIHAPWQVAPGAEQACVCWLRTDGRERRRLAVQPRGAWRVDQLTGEALDRAVVVHEAHLSRESIGDAAHPALSVRIKPLIHHIPAAAPAYGLTAWRHELQGHAFASLHLRHDGGLPVAVSCPQTDGMPAIELRPGDQRELTIPAASVEFVLRVTPLDAVGHPAGPSVSLSPAQTAEPVTPSPHAFAPPAPPTARRRWSWLLPLLIAVAILSAAVGLLALLEG